MEQVNPDQYIKSNKEHERFLASPEERQEMPTYAKIGLGAVAAGALLGGAYRAGAMRKVANFLDGEASISLQAVKEAIQEEGHLMSEISMDRARNFGRRIKERRRDLLNKRIEDSKDILNTRTFDAQRVMDQQDLFIGKDVKHILQEGRLDGEVPYAIEEGLRFQAVMRDVRNSTDQAVRDQADDIERALGRGSIGDLKNKERDHVRYLLENEDIHNKDVIKMVQDVTEAHSKTRFILGNQSEDQTKQALAWVEGMQERLRQFSADHLEGAIRKNGKIREAVIGHKQATINDMMKLNQENRINMDVKLQKQLEEATRRNADIGDMPFDEHLYIDNRTGNLTDYKSFDNVKKAHMEWWSHTIPGGLLHLRDILNVKAAREQATFRIMKRQTVQPALNAQKGLDVQQSSSEEVLFINGKLVKLFDDKAVNSNEALDILNKDRDMYLTSSRFGTIADVQKHASGVMTTGKSRNIDGSDRERSWIERWADIGDQSKDAGLSSFTSIATKHLNPDYEGNRVLQALRGGIKNTEEFYDMQRYFDKYTQGFSGRFFDQFKGRLARSNEGTTVGDFIHHNEINFSRDEDVIKLFEHMGESKEFRKNYRFSTMYQQYKRNPYEFLGKKLPIGETNPVVGGNVRVQSGLDKIKQQMSMELINKSVKDEGLRHYRSGQIDNLFDAEDYAKMRLFDDIDTLYKDKTILKNDKQQAEWMMNHYMFQQAGSHINSGANSKMDQINNLFTGSSSLSQRFQKGMGSMKKVNNPWYEPFSSVNPVNKVEDEFILVNKAFNSHTTGGRLKEVWDQKWDILHDFNPFKKQFKSDLMKQASLTTGRDNMEDFTSLTMLGYYLPYRLQDALGSFGLAFSDASMKSAGHIWSNLFMKRIGPAFGAVGSYQYADYQLDKHTGAGIEERYQNWVAHERLEEARDLEESGHLEEVKRSRMLRPGMEHFENMPDMRLPVFGEIGAGHMLNSMVGGMTGMQEAAFEDQAMSVEETYQDITEGQETIRKGRWWAFGSKTAYQGGRITEFAPNAYRRAHSDWEYTDTMYGEDGERWENSFFPTLENPIGALGYLTGSADPYWFEKKHYYDRPYMLTGELFNPNTMLAGDIGNMTIGAILKPVKRMHDEYWGDPVVVQEQADQVAVRPIDPVDAEVSPAGRMNLHVNATTEQYGVNKEASMYTNDNPVVISKKQVQKDEQAPSGAKYVAIPRQVMTEEGASNTGDEVVTNLETGESIYIPARIKEEYQNYDQAFVAAKAPVTDQAMSRDVETRPRGMMNRREYAAQEMVDRRKLEELKDPRSADWRAQELARNWLEPHGVYNWIMVDEIMQWDPYAGQTVIERADAATNASNAFWESELGSLGGSVSEIGRRFIRNDSGQLESYNPIRNTMPDWINYCSV